MPISKFNNVKVSCITTTIPENFKKLEDELDTLYRGDIKHVNRIKKSIGLDKRHVVQENTTTADLCEYSAENILNNYDVNREDIDALILVTQTPDYFQPATAAYLHGKLNLSQDCATFDVNQGCTGYIYGLWLAYMMVETNSCANVLLLAGDTLSKTVNPLDTNTAPLFGDAGTATLIQRAEIESKSFFTLHTNGKEFDTIIQPKGAFRTPSPQQINNQDVFNVSGTRTLDDLYMDGAKVFNFSLETEPKAIQEILKISNKTVDDIDYIVFHQANKYIISNISRRLKFPLEKAPSETTGKYGNQSSASIPSTICDVLNTQVSNSTLDLILSGFGVGLSWASCNIVLENIYCPSILLFKEK